MKKKWKEHTLTQMKTKCNFMVFLGNRIKKAREQAGLTQEELAGLIGISRTAIARYELGEIEPKIRNLIAIAEQLHVSVDYLLGIDNDRPEISLLGRRVNLYLFANQFFIRKKTPAAVSGTFLRSE